LGTIWALDGHGGIRVTSGTISDILARIRLDAVAKDARMPKTCDARRIGRAYNKLFT